MAQYATPAEAGVSVGDFFVCSWGYDQTNIDFYKVVALTPKGIKIQKWQSAMAEVQDGGGYTDALVPGGGPVTYKVLPDISHITDPETGQVVEVFTDTGEVVDYHSRQERAVEVPVKPEQKRIQTYGTGENRRAYFTVNSFSSASKWSGSPAHQTAFGYGH